ncbi:MAG TPA: hypothetical protein VGK33_13110, partial [Chloroflexota bacterium]
MDAEAVFRWLGEPGSAIATTVRANALAVAADLSLWLALHDDRFCAVRAEGTTAESVPRPPLYSHGHHVQTTIGLLGGQGLALLGRTANEPSLSDDDWSADAVPFVLEVRGFGRAADLRERLAALVVDWDRAGRPTVASLGVRLFPRTGER